LCNSNFGVHTNAQVDCLGFGRVPNYLGTGGTGQQLGTGCFQIPQDMEPGVRTLRWVWQCQF
jgi:hypothetical protein